MFARSFAGTLLFGALAAAAWPLLFGMGCALVGCGPAFGLGLAGIAAVYSASLAQDVRGALGGGLVAAAISGGALLVWPEPATAVGASALAIAVVRSHWLAAGPPGRALAVEMGLLLGGLAVARAVWWPGPLGTAAALWSFFLVQSLFFLVGGLRPRRLRPASGLDPFEEALRRADRLLEEDPAPGPPQ